MTYSNKQTYKNITQIDNSDLVKSNIGCEELLLGSNKDLDSIDLDIVCVYNNEDFYKNELLASLDKQATSYGVRIIGINNSNRKYSSMSQAYNSVTNHLKGKWVLFLHQDIRFDTETSLNDIINDISKLSEHTIWGSAGVKRDSRNTICSTDKPINVETVDECFFGMATSLFLKLQFNEVLCDNWHMYAVEICLNNKCNGGDVCVVKTDITHISPGTVSKDYVKTLYKIIDYYKEKNVKAIWTTCAKINLEKPYRLYISIWITKHEILNKIVRPLMAKFKK